MVNQSPVRNRISLNSSGIPDKLYYRIGEVARICQVPAYVLRFWETEFPQLRPNKGGSGQRLFRRRDVEIALRIKRLLYDEGYTIPGARQLLKGEGKQPEQQLSLSPDPQLLSVRTRSPGRTPIGSASFATSSRRSCRSSRDPYPPPHPSGPGASDPQPRSSTGQSTIVPSASSSSASRLTCVGRSSQ